LGYKYGKLAVAMNERFDDIALKSRIIYVYTMFIHHWSKHWSSMTPWFLKGIEAGYQSGDLLYLAYSAQDCIIWDPKLDLESASQRAAQVPGDRPGLQLSGLAGLGDLYFCRCSSTSRD
jgi:predicted ATPase